MNELRTLEARLDELARFYADGLLDLRSWTVARERLEHVVVAAREQIARLHRPRVLLDLPFDLAAAWEAQDTDWRRAHLVAVLQRVVVNRSDVTATSTPAG